MSSWSGLRRVDGQRLSLVQASIAGPTTPLLHAVSKYPTRWGRRLLDALFAGVTGNQQRGVRDVDLTIPGAGAAPIRARLYTPRSVGPRSPLLVYYHGGGFVVGSIDSHAPVCRFIAREAHCRVLAIDYRKAPKHRFPVALHDAVAGFRWAVAHARDLSVNPKQIAVGGDSAGGNLAAGVCLETNRDIVRPRCAWLMYPVVDSSLGDWDSAQLFANGPILSAACAQDMLGHYAPRPDDRDDPRFSVLHHEHLHRMPATYIATAGMDPLRDQGEAFAQKLRQAGVAVTSRRWTNLPHGFLQLLISRRGRAAAYTACTELPDLLSAPRHRR